MTEGSQIRESRLFLSCLIGAFFLEVLVIQGVAHYQHSIAHPSRPHLEPESHIVEAELRTLPDTPKLIKRSQIASVPKASPIEKAISTQVKSQEERERPSQEPPSQENIVESGPPLPPTHGPIAVYAPSPILPSYLQNRAYRAHVSIEFLVDHRGTAKPRLVIGSGDEELDALALSTVKTWKFKPAEEAHHPISSRVKLKIVFDVH